MAEGTNSAPLHRVEKLRGDVYFYLEYLGENKLEKIDITEAEAVGSVKIFQEESYMSDQKLFPYKFSVNLPTHEPPVKDYELYYAAHLEIEPKRVDGKIVAYVFWVVTVSPIDGKAFAFLVGFKPKTMKMIR